MPKPRLHIALPYKSAAMLRVSAPLLGPSKLSNLYEITTSPAPDSSADINYHIPWHTLAGYEGGGRNIMYYTHCNPADRERLADAMNRADGIICMSFAGREELVEMGADPAKIWVIYAPVEGIPLRRRNVGVIGFEQPNGRKRLHFLLDIVWKLPVEIVDAINFVLVGGGMEAIAEQMTNAGAHVQALPLLTPEQLAEVYQQLDVLLVTGYTEGGPLPVLEAFAAGVPHVLAPPFGFAADFLPDQVYHTDQECLDRLESILRPVIDRHLLSRFHENSLYIAEHALVFGRLTGTSCEAVEGADRYAQLLDIIEREKIRSVAEIGTWNGTRALQMIQAMLRHIPPGDPRPLYAGFDLFERQTGAQLRTELSKRSAPIEVVHRRLEATGINIHLIAGDTRETLAGFPGAELTFIDGGHSLQTVANDWAAVEQELIDHPNICVVVFDDYYLEGREGFGCRQLVDGLDREIFDVEILPACTRTPDALIAMAKVTVKHAAISVPLRTEAPAHDIAPDGREPADSVRALWWTHASRPANRAR